MDDIDIIEKARKLCYKFKEIYGVFPEKIGAHYQRSDLLGVNVELWEFDKSRGDIELLKSLMVSRRMVKFKPCFIIGFDDMIFFHENIGEVSLKDLDNYQKVMNNEGLLTKDKVK